MDAGPEQRSPTRSAKKQRTVPADSENRTTRGTRSAKKRKSCPEPEESVDVEMADLSGEIVTKAHPTRRSLIRALDHAANIRTTSDQSSMAAPETTEIGLSPFKLTCQAKATQTAQIVVYDQKYIDFLKDSHHQSLRAKDEELAELQAKEKSLRQQVQRLESELKREQERAGLERGWKKHF